MAAGARKISSDEAQSRHQGLLFFFPNGISTQIELKSVAPGAAALRARGGWRNYFKNDAPCKTKTLVEGNLPVALFVARSFRRCMHILSTATQDGGNQGEMAA
jgi:hypothetical protein